MLGVGSQCANNEEIALIESILSFVADHHQGWGVLVLFLSSLVEYIFPPFPGDVITLFGTWLVVEGHWSFAFALSVVTAGSLVGAAMDYGLGVILSRRLEKLPLEKDTKYWTPLTKEKYELVTQKFIKHGAVYILINRFLPGIRAFFFVVAGAVRMPIWKVMVYAGISALVWNTVILIVGYIVGTSWEALRSFFASYTIVVWCVLTVTLVAGLLVWMIRRKNITQKTG